ncbi:clathrin light chain 1-like [Dorcoceras hygrometricum]|uniref:Clathrin light chain n=1 Tax=Dorcoceras hygrometricum TaxID=472368 RepID=A0A2Z7AM15_9LAMI|nr:clathrin light chain 1-like [Dorcoceras hygrometricum]
MDSFDDGGFGVDPVNDVVEGIQDGMHYGFEGDSDVAPPSMGQNNSMQHYSADDYGYGDDENGQPYGAADDNNEGIFTSSDGGGGGGPLLPEPSQMREESSAFREWRRQNAIYLEAKEKKEKEMRDQIIAEAEEYKRQFYEKRTQNCENNKALNREREKLYHANQERFHKEAHQQYWKAIEEIIPREVSKIERRRGRKEDEKKVSVEIIQGPKPGKPTDMSRMRQVLLKLKQTPPPHMIPPKKDEAKDAAKEGKDAKDGISATPNPSKDGKDAKDGSSGSKNPSKDGKDAATQTASPAAGDKSDSDTKSNTAPKDNDAGGSPVKTESPAKA